MRKAEANTKLAGNANSIKLTKTQRTSTNKIDLKKVRSKKGTVRRIPISSKR